jgi:hypothetical protein
MQDEVWMREEEEEKEDLHFESEDGALGTF